MPRNLTIREARRELAPRFKESIAHFRALALASTLADDPESAFFALPEEVHAAVYWVCLSAGNMRRSTTSTSVDDISYHVAHMHVCG